MWYVKKKSMIMYIIDKMNKSTAIDENGHTFTTIEGIGRIVKKFGYFYIKIAEGVNRVFRDATELVDYAMLRGMVHQ